MSTAERLDILIVGAGLSGIGTAHHLKSEHPDRSFAILESRPQIGGTWDLFRYPGIRSDSDMHTLGYRFRPWTDAKSIADGASILDYIRSTATESGIDTHIRFGHRVVAADWSAATSTWRVKVIAGETTRFFECSFLVMCSGYYSYDAGYTPELKGIHTFEGRVVHPQQWPEDLDHSGRDIVVIGSGATAVTLVPALAKSAAHVTMLQRSPTYIMSVPSQDVIANTLRRLVGSQLSYRLTRWKNVATAWAVYELSRRCPSIIKAMVRKNVAKHLPVADVDAHFTPSYQPWDQRLCATPDGDLFRSLKSGRASVVTDTIDTFTDVGIRLTSGTTLRADIVVTATGLDLLFFGGIDLRVNGNRVNVAEAFAYKGMMLSDVPNFVYTLGYTNSSWTLKADLVSQYLCRLIDFMDSHGYTSCVPHPDDLTMPRRPLFDFEAGYVKRALDRMPSSGPRAPWRQGMNYIEDVITMRHRAIDDGVLQFHRTEHAQPGQDPSTAENHRPDPSHCETGVSRRS